MIDELRIRQGLDRKMDHDFNRSVSNFDHLPLLNTFNISDKSCSENIIQSYKNTTARLGWNITRPILFLHTRNTEYGDFALQTLCVFENLQSS